MGQERQQDFEALEKLRSMGMESHEAKAFLAGIRFGVRAFEKKEVRPWAAIKEELNRELEDNCGV